jgi:hypothetical protein
LSDSRERLRSPTNQRGTVRRWAKIGYFLLMLSAPALLEIFFEVVLLTLSSGPQMLFYSIIHTVGNFMGFILGVSLLTNPVFALYALGLLAYHATRGLAQPVPHFRIIIGGFVFQAVVFFLLFTYDYWAYPLFG